MKKKFLDPQIVIKRTGIMMDRQLGELSKYFGAFEKNGDSYYAWLPSGQSLSVCYYEDSKFMSKVFSTKITLELEDVVMERSWEARLSFRGTTKISSLLWQPEKKEYRPAVENLNRKSTFNARLLELVRQIDLVTIRLKYSADSHKLVVSVLPYAGSYVWIKLPPAYCDVPLKDFEVQAISEIVDLFLCEFVREPISESV